MGSEMCIRDRDMDFPSLLFSLYTPGVSRKISCESSKVFTPRILFLVVLGLSETAETFSPTMEFTSVDLPTLGRPITEINPDLKFSLEFTWGMKSDL